MSGRHGLLALSLVLACSAGRAQAQPAPPPKAAAPSVPAAGRPTGIEKQDIRAQLMPRRYTSLAAEIGAKVQRLPVAEGASFKQGQLLVAFDCSVQQAQHLRAQAELKGADQTLQANERLAQLNSIGQLELDMARVAQGKARAELKATEAVLGKCGIAAPFAGRIAEQKVREQQFVQPGQALLEIIDDSQLELEFLVPSRWLAWLRVGAAFEVLIDETGRSYPARFIRIGARVDPVSQSVKVAAAIQGRPAELIAGMSGKVLIQPPAP